MRRDDATPPLSSLLDLDSFRYDTFESPIGALAVVLGNQGIALLDMADDGVHERFRARLSQKIRHTSFPPDWASAIVSVLSGSPPSLLRFDLSKLTSFQRSVLGAVSEIPCGETRSYGRIAAAIGHPRAARAVGTAVARNPIPVLIPCHRVLPATGEIGRYSMGGPLIKKALLDHEKVVRFSTQEPETDPNSRS